MSKFLSSVSSFNKLLRGAFKVPVLRVILKKRVELHQISVEFLKIENLFLVHYWELNQSNTVKVRYGATKNELLL